MNLLIMVNCEEYLSIISFSFLMRTKTIFNLISQIWYKYHSTKINYNLKNNNEKTHSENTRKNIRKLKVYIML